MGSRARVSHRRMPTPPSDLVPAADRRVLSGKLGAVVEIDVLTPLQAQTVPAPWRRWYRQWRRLKESGLSPGSTRGRHCI